jgi:hypothetical protein
MKTQLLIVSGAVLGMAVGFVAGRIGSEDGPVARGKTSPRPPSRAAAGGPRVDAFGESAMAALLKGRSVNGISAEEAYKLIAPYLSNGFPTDPLGRARVEYQYQLLAERLPPAVLQEMLVMGLEKGVPLQRLSPLFGAYAERDWDRAMAWAEKQPDAAKWRIGAVQRLSMIDPDRANGLYQEELLNGLGQGASMDIRNNLAAAHLKQGPEAFFRFLDSLPSNSALGLTSVMIRQLPPEELPAFIEEFKRREASVPMYDWEVNNLMMNIAAIRPELAREWLDTLGPEKERVDYEFNMAMSMGSSGKLAEMEELIRKAMAQSPGEEKTLVTNRLPNLFPSNPEMAVRLVAMLPDDQKLTREDARKAVGPAYHRPERLMDVVRLIGSPEEQSAYLAESFDTLADPRMATALGMAGRLNAKDLEIMEHRLESLGLEGVPGDRARAALEKTKASLLGNK